MKRELTLFIILLTFSHITFCQKIDVVGNYSYSSKFYYENISLMENGKFIWNVNTEFLRLESFGNWQIRNDSLILDSNPQRDKLIVRESKNGNSKATKFYITDKDKDLIRYTLCIITSNNDTIIYNDQFKETIVKSNIKAFYIIDTKGLYSPVYYIEGKNTNRLDIMFETRRTFENEIWLINNGYIIPRGSDRNIQKYKLVKR